MNPGTNSARLKKRGEERKKKKGRERRNKGRERKAVRLEAKHDPSRRCLAVKTGPRWRKLRKIPAIHPPTMGMLACASEILHAGEVGGCTFPLCATLFPLLSSFLFSLLIRGARTSCISAKHFVPGLLSSPPVSARLETALSSKHPPRKTLLLYREYFLRRISSHFSYQHYACKRILFLLSIVIASSSLFRFRERKRDERLQERRSAVEAAKMVPAPLEQTEQWKF